MSLKEKLEALRKEYEAAGMKLLINDNTLIDENHLDCVWYGGEYAEIEIPINGETYHLHLRVEGDVRITGFDDTGNELWHYVDKNNVGAWTSSCSDLRDNVHSDSEFWDMFDEEHISWDNNNWIEFFVADSKNNGVLEEVVLDETDNLFESLEAPDAWKQVVLDVLDERSEEEKDASMCPKDRVRARLEKIEAIAAEITSNPEPLLLSQSEIDSHFTQISTLAKEAVAIMDAEKEG